MIPVIGILAEIDNKKTLTLKHGYDTAIEKCGGLPLIFPYVEEEEVVQRFMDLCDGFLFSGGADISPSIYGEDKKDTCGEIQAYRDALEVKIMEKAIASKKPILCICRGMQLLNAVLGGTLYQDLESEFISNVCHRKDQAEECLEHEVNVLPNTPLYGIVGSDRMRANSFHHQAIKALSKQLRAMAVADDSIIEAVYQDDGAYICGYQWHPEKLFERDANNQAIFVSFVNECKNVK